jgi:3-hydroxybutyryl-CoA dehydrogenase
MGIQRGDAILRSEHIAIVGAGPMGQGIAQVFASGGHEVILFDPDQYVLEEAIEEIRGNLTVLSKHGLCLQEEIESTLEQIKPASSLKKAVANARFVVEAASKDLEVKQDLFHEMEKFCSPITILATQAAEIRISEIAAKTKAKERIVGTYFWAPAYLIPLVEVAGGHETLQEVKEYTCNILKSVGKYPVMVQGDVPGLIGDRLQHALWQEANTMVAQGIADPKTVGEVIKKGLSLRLATLDFFENTDSTDLDQPLQMHEPLLKTLLNVF